MKVISVEERLPENNQYVLVHLTKDNWGDADDPDGNRYWKVAKFIRGISEEDRLKMKKGLLPDPDIIGWTCPTPPGKWISHVNKRSATYQKGDVHGNNTVPYVWEEFGPSSYSGQEVDYWCELPVVPECA